VADEGAGGETPDRSDMTTSTQPGRRTLTQKETALLTAALAVFSVIAGVAQLVASTLQTLMITLFIVLAAGLVLFGTWTINRGRQLMLLSFRLLALLIIGAILAGAGGTAGVRWMLDRQAVKSQPNPSRSALRSSPSAEQHGETLPASTTSPAARPTSSPSSVVTVPNDVVKIGNIEDQPGIAKVTVRVSGPPSLGTHYLLVVHHNGGYQFKGKIDPAVGDHVVDADLRLAAPGSWRDFFVVGADAAAVAAWEATVKRSRVEMPAGTRELTQRIPHQMPA
jgi:hypothetical protein